MSVDKIKEIIKQITKRMFRTRCCMLFLFVCCSMYILNLCIWTNWWIHLIWFVGGMVYIHTTHVDGQQIAIYRSNKNPKKYTRKKNNKTKWKNNTNQITQNSIGLRPYRCFSLLHHSHHWRMWWSAGAALCLWFVCVHVYKFGAISLRADHKQVIVKHEKRKSNGTHATKL